MGLEAQLPEHLGSIRTVSQGKGSQLLVGTTKNSILTGNFDLNFQEIMVGHVGEVRPLHNIEMYFQAHGTWDWEWEWKVGNPVPDSIISWATTWSHQT